MLLLSFLFLLVTAAIAGSLGQSLAGYSVGGWITLIMVGFIGATEILFNRSSAHSVTVYERRRV